LIGLTRSVLLGRSYSVANQAPGLNRLAIGGLWKNKNSRNIQLFEY